MRIKQLQSYFKLVPILAGITVMAISSLVWFSFGYEKPDLLTSFDSRIFDAMFRYRGPEKTSGSVVIVDIDEKSLKKNGQWPWPRDVVADLVRKIRESGTRITGFDIVFAERDQTSPAMVFKHHKERLQHLEGIDALKQMLTDESLDHDTILGNEIAETEAVLGYLFIFKNDGFKKEDERPFPSINIRVVPSETPFSSLTLTKAYRPLLNIPELSMASSEGFFNVFPEAGGTVRKVPLFLMMDGIPYPSLAFELVRTAEKIRDTRIHVSSSRKHPGKTLLGVSMGNRFIPTDTRGHLAVNFRGPVYSFPYVSSADVLEGKKGNLLKGKYVLLGSSAAGVMDLVATPFSPTVPGVEVHATVIDNLIRGDPMVQENHTEIGLTYVLIAAGGLVMTLALFFSGPLSGSVAGSMILCAVVVGNYHLFFLKHHLVGISYALISLLAVFITVTVFNYFYEGRKRQFVKKAFSQYVSPSLVSQLIREPEKLTLIARKKKLTIFFSDIRGFTTLSESMSPENLGNFLNEYLSVLSDIIMKHRGMVDKYIGDAVMAVWGTPLDDEEQAVNAVLASLEIQQALKEIGSTWKSTGARINTGIGINTGAASAGNFGSTRRFDYTVLGDNVNLASRLEGLNKIYGAGVIISEFTQKEIKDRFYCRYLDTVRVKGKKTPVRIYEPLFEGKPDDTTLFRAGEFERALGHYRRKEFSKAAGILHKLYEEDPDTVYKAYLNRMELFLKNLPPPEWDGVYDLN